VPLLETIELSKHFAGLKALHEVNLKVEEGKILGIIGPNGAGKTTLFNTITSIYKPTAGQVLFRGEPIHHLRPFEIAQKGIGRTFQITRPFKNLSVWKNVLVAYGHKQYLSLKHVFGRYQREENNQEVLQLLQQVGLEEYKEVPAKNLPLGLQKRLEIARALALNPILLMLDEPCAGLGHEESQELVNLIRNVRAQGKTIVLVEHNMSVAMGLCDRMVVLSYGSKIAEGRPEEIKSDPKVIEAYLGKEEEIA
jgi:branched-chain amino acid transport system ATP-binding protein